MNNEIKLFLSSTFDKRMHARRDYFKNEINAHLNRIVGKIGENLFVYDYEVGIPEETEFSDVLNVCFEKIDACNYFVAIIDNRYGCNINRKIKDCTGVKKQYQKLVKKGLEKKLSVFELEIIRAFENKDTKKFFFIHQDAQNKNSKLQNLIQYIKTNIPSENIKDFSKNSEILTFLEKHFNEKSNDILHQYSEEEQRRNLMYANKMRYYVEDDTIVNVLNNYITDDCNKVLVLNGKSGSGKSTLLLNWIEQHRSDTDKNIISCFVDIDGYTVSDVFRKFNNQNTESQAENFDDKKDEISILDSFIPFTHSLSKKHKKNIIVLDGLDQINFTNERKGEAAKYYWLNETLPKNVKVIVSTTDNKINKTKFLVYSITPYSLSKIVKYHLKKEGKELLYPDFEKHIDFNNKNIDNIPVVARLICSEICMTADYQNLSQFLLKYNEQLISGASIIDLHEAFLKRIAQRNSIAPEICSYLWCSESGLDANTMCELFALQGKNKKEQVENFNTMLYSDLRTNVDGRMEFSHSYFKQAVEKLYVENNQDISHYRNDIIEVLQKNKLSEKTLPECAHQINMLENKNKMFELLSDIDNARELYNINRIQFLEYLQLTENKSNLFNSYDSITLQQKNIKFLAQYFKEIPEYGKSIDFYKLLVSKLGNNHAALYNEIAEVYCDMGKYAESLDYCNKALSIYEGSIKEYNINLASIYYNMGLNYRNMGEHNLALELYNKALEIRKKKIGKEHPDLATTYNSIAVVYGDMKKHELALEWYDKALEIRNKSLGKEHPDTATSYNDIGVIHYDMGNYSMSLEWYMKAKLINEKILGIQHHYTATVYNNIANAHKNLNNYDEAEKWLYLSLEIRQKVLDDDHPDIAQSFNNLGSFYKIIGNCCKALEYANKALDIKKNKFDEHHLSIAITYNLIAGIYAQMGNNNKALEFYVKTWTIRKLRLGDKQSSTMTTYNNIYDVYKKILIEDYKHVSEWYLKAQVILKNENIN
jgi:tetratricopeptide (TPR) repeat protein